MGQVLHGSAATTEAMRRAIKDSQESLRVLARRDGIDPKTVAKEKRRKSVKDLPTGPKVPHSIVLSLEEAAVIAAFRRHTLLLLDDCLHARRLRFQRSSARFCIGCLFVAVDRTSKFAFVQLVERTNTKTASALLDALVVSGTLPHPHGAHRKRHPIRRSAEEPKGGDCDTAWPSL